MSLSTCAVVLLSLPLVQAGWWDDVSNNLATDLAPLLSLFGEQITKQYLSESINKMDYFIFAMAPMGILTAVVSAIRVCGSPSLRAFIGRAQEGGGMAEAELCSSTSRDVCELYNNGGIARVFGRPKILELVYDKAAPNFTENAGIFTFREYIETKWGGEEWEIIKNPRPAGRNASTHSSLYWIQPGGQVLGDQTFDPFCHTDGNEPLQEYQVSPKKTPGNSEQAVWAAVGITISGFVLQFIGLRGIHSAVSVAQLGAIMVMSAARAALRMQRLKPSDNSLVKFPDEVVGHELDWLALHIGRKPEGPRRGSDSSTSSLSLEEPSTWRVCGIPKAAIMGQPPLSLGGTDPAEKILAHRTRLAKLTESSTTQEKYAIARNFKIEMVEARGESQRLADAITSVVNAIFSQGFQMRKREQDAPQHGQQDQHQDGQQSQCQDGQQDRQHDQRPEKYIWWPIDCYFSSNITPPNPSGKDPHNTGAKQETDTIYLKLCHTAENSWKLDNQLDLESLLGLWLRL